MYDRLESCKKYMANWFPEDERVGFSFEQHIKSSIRKASPRIEFKIFIFFLLVKNPTFYKPRSFSNLTTKARASF